MYGPPGSGKSHLAHAFRQRSGALPLEAAALAGADLPRLLRERKAFVLDLPDGYASAGPGERQLLHAYNLIAERAGQLLICARQPPARWGLQLPDLASRLGALPAVRIDPPDDALLAALLLKLFADRQLAAEPGLAIYLAARIERSFEAARRIVAALDRTALASRRRITTALAAEVLAAGDSDEPI